MGEGQTEPLRERTWSRWKFLVRWAFASAVGAGVAGAVAGLVSSPGLLLFGLLVAVPQWLLLRRYVPCAASWMWATSLSWAIPMFFLLFVSWKTEVFFIALFAAAPATALVVATVQRYWLAKRGWPARWWITASVIGSVLVMPFGAVLWIVTNSGRPWLGEIPLSLATAIIGAVVGLLYGLTTGLTLSRPSSVPHRN